MLKETLFKRYILVKIVARLYTNEKDPVNGGEKKNNDEGAQLMLHGKNLLIIWYFKSLM